MPDGTYSLSDLCDLADVTPRTVRYYISEGLLRSPGTTGPGARYDDGHLARLRLIRRLQREHLPLAEIRARLAAVTDEEAIAQTEGPSEPPTDSALDYVRDVLGARTLRKPSSGGMAPTSARPAQAVPSAPATGHPSPPVAALRQAVRLTAAGSSVAEGAAPHGEGGQLAEVRRGNAPAQVEDAATQTAPATSELSGAERSHWERFALAPDVELHVRRPLTRSQNRAVARLLEAARQILEEERQ